jgi:hypothetical protein
MYAFGGPNPTRIDLKVPWQLYCLQNVNTGVFSQGDFWRIQALYGSVSVPGGDRPLYQCQIRIFPGSNYTVLR